MSRSPAPAEMVHVSGQSSHCMKLLCFFGLTLAAMLYESVLWMVVESLSMMDLQCAACELLASVDWAGVGGLTNPLGSVSVACLCVDVTLCGVASRVSIGWSVDWVWG